MKHYLAITLAGMLIAAPVAAVDFTAEEAQRCEAGGGCLVLTRAALVDALRQARQQCAGLRT